MAHKAPMLAAPARTLRGVPMSLGKGPQEISPSASPVPAADTSP